MLMPKIINVHQSLNKRIQYFIIFFKERGKREKKKKNFSDLFRKLVSWCELIRGDVNTRGGELSPENP